MALRLSKKFYNHWFGILTQYLLFWTINVGNKSDYKELTITWLCNIPNLGGFVAQYSPSNFDKKIIYTSQTNLFNKNLVNNDGLLLNALAHKNNISYENAVESFQTFFKK